MTCQAAPDKPSGAKEHHATPVAPVRYPHNRHIDAVGVGVGFKHDHADAILEDAGNVGFLEVHAENYMGDGGHPHRILDRIRRDFPVSIHGVSMSLGGPDPLDEDHLDRFAALVHRYEPALVSEHLAWSTHDDIYYNDLLPLPYTERTLRHVCDHINMMQDRIGRTILLENPATYLLFKTSTMTEIDFLTAIADKTGCGLLLDVNNIFVSACNHGFSARNYLDAFPLHRVGEIHLAGHTEQTDKTGKPVLIDSHDKPVSDDVWRLYKLALQKMGPTPTLVEWDSDLPEWDVLRDEADKAHAVQIRMKRIHEPLGRSHYATA